MKNKPTKIQVVLRRIGLTFHCLKFADTAIGLSERLLLTDKDGNKSPNALGQVVKSRLLQDDKQDNHTLFIASEQV